MNSPRPGRPIVVKQGKRRRHAEAIWRAGVQAVEPGALVRRHLRLRGRTLWVAGKPYELPAAGRIAVVGAGKAGAAMAGAASDVLGKAPRGIEVLGWVNVPDSDVRPLGRIVLHGARPPASNVPTLAGVEGARRILEIARSLDRRDVLLVLVSGGGSALLPAPAGFVTLPDKLRMTELLLASGATINEMNAVRKHVSDIKGGGLVRATRARVAALVISDVVGDPLDVIASGPTAPDPTTYADALAVLDRYDLMARAPRSVVHHLECGEEGEIPETIKPPGPRVHNAVVGNNRVAVEAAARRARELGYRVMSLGSCVEGESREVGVVLAGIARGFRDEGRARRPVCLLSGGETTVRLTGDVGRGGRNQELVLAAAAYLWEDGLRQIVVLSGGTDGEDGPTDAAGAVADTALVAEAKRLGLDPRAPLAGHDAYPFFEKTGGLLKTGPTGTNVTDLRVVLVG